MTYTQHFSTKKTPQTQPIPGKDMVENSAGGFVFKLSPDKQLMRFLILGSEGGTYYASEKKLTVENAQSIVNLLKNGAMGSFVVGAAVGVSDAGRAAKKEPAIFTIALACTFGDQETKAQAYEAIHKVCKTGTQLFTFCQYIQDLRGWSRGLRNGVAKFYTEKTPEKLGYQLIKYRQRNGWTHKDVMRLSHPKPKKPQEEIFKFAVDKEFKLNQLPEQVQAYLKAQSETNAKKLSDLIIENRLPREAIPTEMLKKKEIWDALLMEMPMTAMIRNLGVMTANGTIFSNFDEATKHVTSQLTDPDLVKKAKIHPFNVLMALKTYAAGRGFKGKLTWTPVQKIIDALDDAFYMAFENVEPTNKNILIGLDVSGSMSSSTISNSNISAREASTAMCMVTARSEKFHQINLFSNRFIPVTWSTKARLDQICRETERLPFEGTDCSLPMLYAIQNKLPIDTFIIYTDNETYAGSIHPKQALDRFRQASGRDAKCIVVGMTATGFTIADLSDAGMLDIVGFDASAPALINEFIMRGF